MTRSAACAAIDAAIGGPADARCRVTTAPLMLALRLAGASMTRPAALPNLREPVRLDVCDDAWGLAAVDAIFNANMIHIAPWEVAVGLVQGAARQLLPSGLLVIYGPFRIDGQHTAPSNQSFDATLRERDARFGVRDLEALVTLAHQHRLELQERIEMPANNQTLVFAAKSAGSRA